MLTKKYGIWFINRRVGDSGCWHSITSLSGAFSDLNEAYRWVAARQPQYPQYTYLVKEYP